MKNLKGTMILAALFGLAGCGSSSDSKTVEEYSLSEYEGRTVSTADISGTWVAVGRGSSSYSGSFGSGNTEFAAKEYFVIQSGSNGFSKSSCAGESSGIYIEGDQITIGSVQGTITNNSFVVGSSEFSNEYGGEVSETSVNLTMVKISDSTDSIGTFSINQTGYGDNSYEVSCFNQSNGVESWEGGEANFLELEVGFGESYNMSLEEWFGPSGYTWLYFGSRDLDLDTDYGASAQFSIDASSEFSQLVTFSGSADGVSASGSIQIQLPLQ